MALAAACAEGLGPEYFFQLDSNSLSLRPLETSHIPDMPLTSEMLAVKPGGMSWVTRVKPINTSKILEVKLGNHT
jgi:hypothetical protein